MARETGWVIEANGTYWDGHYPDSSAFGLIKNAVRFARQEDGEVIKYWLLRDHAFALRVTEHIWVDQPAKTGDQSP